MKPTIILIGPLGAGKTTTAHLLAHKLGLPHCSLDTVRWKYYEELGYDKALAAKLAQTARTVQDKMHYAKPFEAHAAERVLADHPHSVIDFGASNTVYEEPGLSARVEKVLAPYPNVILLLPTSDPDESAAILRARLTKMLKEKGEHIQDELFEYNSYFIKHPSSYQLAKIVIYTKDKTPEEICDEISQKLIE